MEELYGEGVASHTGRESCAAGREACREALTVVRAGPVIEPRKYVEDADPVPVAGRRNEAARQRERRRGPPGSVNQGTYGTFVHENREASEVFGGHDLIGNDRSIDRLAMTCPLTDDLMKAESRRCLMIPHDWQ